MCPLLPRGHALLIPALLGLLLLLPGRAAADDLFEVTITNTANDQVSRATSSSMLRLARDVAGQEGRFNFLEDQPYIASFNYAGLANAIIFTVDAQNTTLTLDIPSINFTRTFNAQDGDLDEQIESFLQSEGAGALASFIRVTNERTLVGVTDGNPSALTAVISNEAFRLFGEYRNPFGYHVQGADGIRLYANAAAIRTDVGDGHQFEGALTSAFRFTNRVGLALDFLGTWRSIEGSETFTAAFIPGLPIRLTPQTTERQPFFWQITPHGHIAGGGSADQISGGLILGAGGTNLLGFRAGDLYINSGQHLGYYTGQPISAGDYRFETDVDQFIFKGSLSLTYSGDWAYLQGGVIYTDFLNDAGVDNYITPFAGVGIPIGRGVFRIGYAGDFGEGFRMHRAEAELRIAF